MVSPTVSQTKLQQEELSLPRPTLLMCSPQYFDVRYVINPWMQQHVGGCSQTRAASQWQGLFRVLSGIANIDLVEPASNCPDMVFTANAGLLCDDKVVLSRFQHPERQAEEALFCRWFEARGYSSVELDREETFEGEGDALFSADRATLWVGEGTRTSLAAHEALRRYFPALDVQGLQLVDPRFYHLDTCFCPLSDGSVMYYPDAFSAASLEVIRRSYSAAQRVEVSQEDALRFACNAVNLGQHVVSNLVSPRLVDELESRGFVVVQTPLDEFLKAGGAAKCLVLHLQ